MTDHDRPDAARTTARRRRRLPVLASASSLTLAATFAWAGIEISDARSIGHTTGASAATATSPITAPRFERPVVVQAGPVGSVAGSSARGAEDLDGIPGPALAGYQRATSVLEVAAPGCGLDWTLLAAIGRVRSDHGERAGHRLTGKGAVRPALVGPAVRKRGGGTVEDTDRGVLDGDRRTDRHIGPLLLTPSQWSLVGVDADDDGKRDPNDVDDAALAAGVLLCAARGNLQSRAGTVAALRALDSDPGFARSVLSVAAGYRAAVDADPGAVVEATAPSTLPDLPPTPVSARDGDGRQQEDGSEDDGGTQGPGGGQVVEHPVEPDPQVDLDPPDQPDPPTDPEQPADPPAPSITTAEAAYDAATLTLTVTIAVATEDGDPADGAVDLELLRDDEVLGTVTVPLEDGTVTHTFTDVAAGSYLVTATYAGTETLEASATELALELE